MRFEPVGEGAVARRRGEGRARGSWARILSQVVELAGTLVELERHAERQWASATFSGARHTLTLSFTGEEAVESGERFIAALPDHEFAIPGHLVADAAIVECEEARLPSPRLIVTAELLILREDL